MSCSHKKNVLYFLDQLCSFYEYKYILSSSLSVESTQEFMDKVYELADENGLPTKGFKSILPEYSSDKMIAYINKACYP